MLASLIGDHKTVSAVPGAGREEHQIEVEHVH
jgi:hypothetical protein